MKIFFNSSMPRSGSTLMQNILGNNPNIFATPTSAVLDMLNSSRKVYTNSPTIKAQDEKDMKSAFLMYSRFALEGYFHGLTDKPYVIDKSRGWAVNMPYINSFYPNPKIICLVRDLRDIMASMEKNYRKHPDKWDISLELDKSTVAERVSLWMSPQSKPVGDTLNKLKEVIFRDTNVDEKICFVRFEDFFWTAAKQTEVVFAIHRTLIMPIDKLFGNFERQAVVVLNPPVIPLAVSIGFVDE
jgi:sulfotransferase